MENENKPDIPPAEEEKQEYKGRNLEEVISLAEHRLKLPRERFNYEIVTEKTRLFGIKTKEIVVFDGPDKNLLLRNDGSLLLALQHVLNKISPAKVQVDCEFFRRRKEKRIKEYAQHVAQQVSQTGKEEILDFMNPYERRIVHIAVNQVSGITSESLGDGFLKKIKVFRVHK
jgi:spoIIIJ-associated protein